MTENEIIDLIEVNGANIAVASTATVYGKSFDLPKNCSFGWEFQFASDGNVDVKIELEQGNEAPTTEEAADTDHYALPDSGGQISSGITDENAHIIAYAPKVSTKARLKLTGQGANHASTELTKARLIISRNL